MIHFDWFNVGWPWMGLGGAVILIILLFKTNIFRSNEDSKWKDVVWLSWLAVPVYLIHQFEEYALHMTDWEYDMIITFYAADGPFARFGDSIQLPIAHFPLMNIAFVWFAIPISAYLSKRYPAVGLASYGFIVANALVHIMAGTALGMSLMENAGVFTGILLFIPLAVWVAYAAVKSGTLTKKEVVLTYISGFIGHVALASCYLFAILGIPAGTILADIVVSFTPMIVAFIFTKLFQIKNKAVQ